MSTPHYVPSISAALRTSAAPRSPPTDDNNIFYLYGLSPISEFDTAWSYALPDGINTPRQLSNESGEITLLARYTPWGDTLETFGTGGFAFGYFGGLMDVAAGLHYIGNGQ